MRPVGAGIVGALGAGIVVGIPSRLIMRLVAISAGHVGTFKWVDSLAILMIYAGAMLPGAVVAAVTTRRVRWVIAAAGSALLFVPATGIAAEEIGGTGGMSTLQWIGLIVSSIAVYITIAILPIVTVWMVDYLRGRTPLTPRDHADSLPTGG
jgi:hypothetical protein